MHVHTMGSATRVLNCLQFKFPMHCRTCVNKGVSGRTRVRGMFPTCFFLNIKGCMGCPLNL